MVYWYDDVIYMGILGYFKFIGLKLVEWNMIFG